MTKEIQEWIDDARSELEAAGLLLSTEPASKIHHRNRKVLYCCHQALEKLLKALFLQQNSNEPQPRIHNLPQLLAQSGVSPDEEHAFVHEHLILLDKLFLASKYTNSGSHPEFYDSAWTGKVESRTREVFEWLSQQLP